MSTRTWLGRAVPIPQVSILTLGGTWLQNDTITLTQNGKALTLTVGATVTIPTILDNLLIMMTGSGTLGSGYSVTAYGNTVGEYAQLTYTEDGSTKLTMTGPTDGRPFTVATTKSSTSGTVSDSTTSGTGTGPHAADDADNWSGDTNPVTGDDLVFDGSSDSDCLYNLDQLAIQPNSLVRTMGYTGKIGLPKVNSTNTSLPFDEYLVDYLTFANDANTNTTTVTIGDGEGAGSTRTKINFADCTVLTVNILGTGQRDSETPGVPALLLQSTDGSAVINLSRGDVGGAFYEGESFDPATINIGYIDNPDTDSALVLGNDADIANATIVISGGTLETNSANGSGTITINAGTVTLKAGAHASIVVNAGVCYYRSSGALSAAIVRGGAALDFSRDLQARIVSACVAYAGARISDPNKTVTWSAGVDLVYCRLTEVDLDLGNNITVTPSAI